MVHLRKISTTELRDNKRFLYSKWCRILISTIFLENDSSATWLEYSLDKNFDLGLLSNHPYCLTHVQSPRRNYSIVFFISNEECVLSFLLRYITLMHLKISNFDLFSHEKFHFLPLSFDSQHDQNCNS